MRGRPSNCASGSYWIQAHEPKSGAVTNVALIGPGSDARDEDLASARRVGALVAESGWVLLTGGLGGVMEAAGVGAASAGGTVIGILPGDDPSEANASVTVPIPTGLGELRNGLLVCAAEYVVCVGGSWGTLSEVALAVRTGRPVVQLGGWGVVDATGEHLSAVRRVATPEEAVSVIRLMASRRSPPP
jgi:uncharacterized protein (TIGR00725 family)